jgi:2-keto-4-pentenoate hydratase/2-oxohepta-3-ene-1,7-dioic acid hydratase in catechol pathway
VQESNTEQLIFGVGEILSFLSLSFTLLPGDVVLTGTPAGVGAFRDPPRFLHDGDVVEVDVEGIGVLRNTMRERP